MSSSSDHQSYEDAVRMIETRRRQARPRQKIKHLSGSTSNTNSTPDLRGSPGITGMREWLTKLGHSVTDLLAGMLDELTDVQQADDINGLNVIHVAGTKGKGSTCAFIEAFLRSHARRTGSLKKTGLYTSPHLIVPEERIRLNSTPLSRALFAKYFFEVCELLPQIAKPYDPLKNPIERGPRYLQLFALLALHVFIREKVDVAILETHCGGEYDATNIVETPLITAITALGMDHIDMLGPTIENIAWHKAGIFKERAIALSAPQDTAPAKILERRGAEKNIKVRFVERDERLPVDHSSLQPDVQRDNASLAAAAAQAFLEQTTPPDCQALTPEDIATAIESFQWPGRFQTIRDGQHVWFLDSAHNDMSVVVAAQWFSKEAAGVIGPDTPRILIFSHINELRDSASLLKTLGCALQRADAKIEHVIFSTYDESAETTSHSIPKSPELFYDIWKSTSNESQVWNEPTIQGAIALARRLNPEGAKTLITGSQHLVGPALKVLGWRSDSQRS